MEKKEKIVNEMVYGDQTAEKSNPWIVNKKKKLKKRLIVK